MLTGLALSLPSGAATAAPFGLDGWVVGAVQADGMSQAPSISADGRFVVFGSSATNLVPGDTNRTVDIFVRDMARHATTRVSVSSAGTQANGPSWDGPQISANGRWVAFGSDATNLVAGDTNHARDLFVRDLRSATTKRVNLNSTGQQASDGVLSYSMSADGRFVSFVSIAANLVPKDTNRTFDVFVRDLVTGKTTRVDVSSGGQEANGASYGGTSLSADGRYVAFTSTASNLVAGDTNDDADVFVRDLRTAITRRASVSSAGTQGNGGLSSPVTLSGDGRYLVFESDATNLVPDDTNALDDVFRRDLVLGSTVRVNVSTSGAQANSFTYNTSALSGDGVLIGFTSMATNLVSGESNLREDVFLRDVAEGTTTRLTLTDKGQPGNGTYSHTGDEFLSADRRFVVFTSDSSNLVPGDTNANDDVFLRDLTNHTVTRVSLGSGRTGPVG